MSSPGPRWAGCCSRSQRQLVGGLALIGALASVGYMLPFSALGGLVGTAIAPRLRKRIGYRWTIVASLMLGALALGGLAFTSNAVLAGVLLALYILHAVVWNICSVSLRQRLVPDALLGRVGGAGRVLGLLGLALGSALGGILGTVHLAVPIAVGAVVFLACCIVALVVLRGQVEGGTKSPLVSTR